MSEQFVHQFISGARGDRGAATLLLLHGTGGDENTLIPLGRALAPGANILSLRGKVLENGMPRFFRRFAEGVLDVEDLKARTHELAQFVESVSVRRGFDLEKTFAVGFSNGANIAAGLLLLHPGFVKGAMLLRPMVPFEPDPLPDLRGTAVWVGAGRGDPLVPPESTERLVEILRASGAEVTLDWRMGGHNLVSGEVEAIAAWLSKVSTSARV